MENGRLLALLGVIVPLSATIYFLSSGREAGSAAQGARPGPASGTETSVSNDIPGARPPVPEHAEPSVNPVTDDDASEKAFTQPESAQQYWLELEMLERSDKRRALAYALAGESWYPGVGRQAEARRAKIVTLMVDLGQMEEARARTLIFIEEYPRSPYRPLVQGVTGIHPRPGAPPL